MHIRDSIKLNSSANDIWDILKNPGNMPAWNPKCQTCTGNDKITIGSTFDATFQLGNKKKTTICEIIDIKPNEKITIRYSGDIFGSNGGYVDESITLIHQGLRQTKVILSVDFTNSKLPAFVKFIMWFISKFGYKVGKSSLDGIEDLLY